MTKWWRKYWKEKRHKRKDVGGDFMGIDSFHIFENKKLFAMKHEDYLPSITTMKTVNVF